MNNVELRNEFLDRLRVKNYSPLTLRAYGDALERLIAFAGERPMLELSLRDLRNFLIAESQAGAGTPTIRIRKAAIQSLSRSFQGRGDYPMQQLATPKHKTRLPDVLTVAQVEKLIGAASNLRDRLLVEMLYATGCRVSEMCHVQLSDISHEESAIRVVGKGDKERIVLYGRKAAALLKKYLAERKDASPWLFPSASSASGDKPITARGVQYIITELAQRAGLPHVHPHTLRHCFASHMVENGADIRYVQSLLGHAFVSQTARYLSLSTQHLVNVHTKAFGDAR